MANTYYTRVTIEPTEAMDKICNMIENMPNSDYGQETKALVQTFYTQEEIQKDGNPISETGVDHDWLYKNVGCKWVTIGIDDDIRMESASSTPEKFLAKLYNICSEEFEDVSVTAKWWDEGETECGVSVVKMGIYAEDNELIESDGVFDPGYQADGEEDIDDITEYLTDNNMSQEELDEMDEDDIRSTFEQWKNEEKWDYISNSWDNMINSCLEAIETEDFEFPIGKVVKIDEMAEM